MLKIIKLNFRGGLFSSFFLLELIQERYGGRMIYLSYIFKDRIMTRPSYLARMTSNQKVEENRPPLKFNFRGGLFSSFFWLKVILARYEGRVMILWTSNICILSNWGGFSFLLRNQVKTQNFDLKFCTKIISTILKLKIW